MHLPHLRDHGLLDHGRSFLDDARRGLHRMEGRGSAYLGEAKSFAGSRAGWAIAAAGAGVAIGLLLNPARKVAWQAHEAVAGDWVEVLKAEHRMVEAAFEAVFATEQHETGKRAALFKKINWALLKHGVQEEIVIYPALREVATEEEAAKHLYEDHADIKTHLYTLANMPKDDGRWINVMRELRALVERHIREEEDEVFPTFRDRLSKEENRKLTLDLHREGVRLA
jgi:hemerythrin superfamily protein